MDTIFDPAPGKRDATQLLVMLPGAMDAARDFVAHGFVDAIRSRDFPVDILLAGADLGDYLAGDFVDSLSRALGDVRHNGQPMWLMGISLGGMGALMYAQHHAHEVEGVIVIAPFLGVQGTIEEIARADGLAQWAPGYISPHDAERSLLAWLKDRAFVGNCVPRIYLAYGREDRFARASEMLAQLLPADRVIARHGAHDWPTWNALWQELLARDVLGMRPSMKSHQSGLC